jgi:hypothetical protein
MQFCSIFCETSEKLTRQKTPFSDFHPPFFGFSSAYHGRKSTNNATKGIIIKLLIYK